VLPTVKFNFQSIFHSIVHLTVPVHIPIQQLETLNLILDPSLFQISFPGTRLKETKKKHQVNYRNIS